MANNISHDVIKDLLPLYVDEVLSEESRRLVDEHLSDCSDCNAYYTALKDGNISKQKVIDDKAALRKIQRKIRIKRWRSVILSVIVVAALSLGCYYITNIKESYLPYEETGLYYEDGYLKTDKNYHCSYSFYRPDISTEFLFMTSTIHSNHFEKEETTLMFSAGEEPVLYNGEISEENEVVNAIYYVPEKYARQLQKQNFWPESGNGATEEEAEANYQKATQEKIEELIESSTLVWKAE